MCLCACVGQERLPVWVDHRSHHLEPHRAHAPPITTPPLAKLAIRHAIRSPSSHSLEHCPQGLRTVDLGAGCWSMHSIRETIGVADIENNFILFRTFFSTFAALDQKCRFGVPKACVSCKAVGTAQVVS